MSDKDIKIVNLVIDSSHRNMSKYPDANYFVHDFDNVIKNVVSVELVYALVDIEPGKMNNRYINITLPEIQDTIITNGNNAVFTQIPMVNFSPNGVEYFRSKFISMKIYNNPLSKLSKLTIITTSEDGNPYEYYKDFLFRFEIKYMLKQIE